MPGAGFDSTILVHQVNGVWEAFAEFTNIDYEVGAAALENGNFFAHDLNPSVSRGPADDFVFELQTGAEFI
ncbi:MAG: hypothetical protein AAFY56_04895 [Pseudomonadota bacterium]